MILACFSEKICIFAPTLNEKLKMKNLKYRLAFLSVDFQREKGILYFSLFTFHCSFIQ